jgi:L-ascorbate metabolism protein UlaG (beta-lactamase superfamily)
MDIRYYGYNTFIIKISNKKIAIDPGALFFYYFRFTTVIPKSEWDDITHIFVTHGDPDHYWHFDRVAKASKAKIILNKTMVKNVNGKPLLLGPRSKGLAFNTTVDNLTTLSVGEVVHLDDMTITGIKSTHGPMIIKLGPFSKTFTPGPTERVGWGSIGFMIDIEGKSIVNLGDSLFDKVAWKAIKEPDILMIPIGGRVIPNTMNEKEAVEAIELMKPKIVIPCHYNSLGLFTKSYNPADVEWFKSELEKTESQCVALKPGQSYKTQER